MVVKIVKLKYSILYQLAQYKLAINKNLHKEKYCYILENDTSLKSMGLGKFNNKIAIGCSSLFVHKVFDKLEFRCYLITPRLLF
jgi:hypothetical protein